MSTNCTTIQPSISIPPNHRQLFHCHDDARLIIFVGGKMCERTFDGTCNFVQGDFVFRPAHFAHADYTAGDGAKFVRLSVSAVAIRQWISHHGWSTARGHVSSVSEEIGDELLAGATSDMLIRPSDPSPINCAALWLASDPRQTAQSVAEKLCLAPHTFSRQFANAHGISPTVYRCRSRLHRAMRMLCESDGSLAEIADASGFCDQSHLTNELQRATGWTPARWRSFYR